LGLYLTHLSVVANESLIAKKREKKNQEEEERMLLLLLISLSALGHGASIIASSKIFLAQFLPGSMQKGLKQSLALLHFLAALAVLFIDSSVVMSVLMFVLFWVALARNLIMVALRDQGVTDFLRGAGEWGFALLYLYQNDDVVSFAVCIKATVLLMMVFGLFFFAISKIKRVKL
jgi:hypothetical protein